MVERRWLGDVLRRPVETERSAWCTNAAAVLPRAQVLGRGSGLDDAAGQITVAHAGQGRHDRDSMSIMAKRGLCVGINDYPGTGDDLAGCIDGPRTRGPRSSLTTSTSPSATSRSSSTMTRHHAVKTAIKALLRGARAGDVLVFTNSSHGTYAADTDGDEPGYDEALCPWDTKDNLLLDDELGELFADVPAGVRLTVLLDSCFSGTATHRVARPRPAGTPAPLPAARAHR